MYMSEPEARQFFDPYFVRFAIGIERGDAEIKNKAFLAEILRAKLDTRAMANIRYSVIVQHVRSLINSDTDREVNWDSRTGIQLLRIRDVAVIRFKQIDTAYLSKNFPTDQARSYEDQALPLGDMPATIAKSTVGWQVDPFGRSVQGRYFLQPNRGKSPQWVISLDEMAGKGVIPLPRRASTTPKQPRVQARPGRKLSNVTTDQS